MAHRLGERKFILPAATILLGAAMVWTDYLDGQTWMYASSGMVAGFYAVTGWAIRTDSVD